MPKLTWISAGTATLILMENMKIWCGHCDDYELIGQMVGSKLWFCSNCRLDIGYEISSEYKKMKRVG